jgi:hypothetical protein
MDDRRLSRTPKEMSCPLHYGQVYRAKTVEHDRNEGPDRIRPSETMDFHAIRHMLGSDPRVKTCRGMPMEERRLAVSPEDIEAYFHQLAGMMQGIPAHFVFNVDKMSHQ